MGRSEELEVQLHDAMIGAGLQSSSACVVEAGETRDTDKRHAVGFKSTVKTCVKRTFHGSENFYHESQRTLILYVNNAHNSILNI